MSDFLTFKTFFGILDPIGPMVLYGWFLTASAFNRLGQYAIGPGNRAYCYAELAVFSPTVVVTIASWSH